jgi:amidase
MSSPRPPHTLTATEALAALADGSLTAEALLRSCLERILMREPVVHAFAHLDPERALAEARARDRIPPAARGLLHGLPLGVKDLIETHDMPTAYGSPIYAGARPAQDAACVALAREAGAVMVGKTVTTEFAWRRPGPTANPHNPAHTTGGSSSGSAAAVADGMVPIAFGTQTAGSIIRPASYCGVVGYKPSFGTLSLVGIKPLATSFDTLGLLARSVDDCALVAGVLSGALRERRDVQPLAAAKPARIGLWRTPVWARAEPASVAAVEGAAERLRAEGVVVDDVELAGDFVQLVDRHIDVMRFEAVRALAFERTQRADQVSPELHEELAAGLALSHAQYRDALAVIARCRAQFAAAIASFDGFISPSASGEAPAGLQATGDPVFNRMVSSLGVPCLSLPGHTGPGGLPVGVQLIGKADADAALLRVAKWVAAAMRDATER